MAKKLFKSRPLNLVSVVLAILFGIISLTLLYVAATNSTSQRSQAAQSEKIIKQWEFTGRTTEGWQNQGFSSLVPETRSGYLKGVFTVKNPSPSLTNQNTAFTWPRGVKTFKTSLRLSPITGQGRQPQQRTLRAPSPVPVPGVKAQVHFYSKEFMAKNQTGEIPGSPLTFTVPADGKFHEQAVNLPDTLRAYSINRMVISFAGLNYQTKGTLEVDWIRVVTPLSPTPSCRPRPACLDANPKCKLPITSDMCPAGTPTPAVGCSYQQVKCVKAPCTPILVCQSPTKPTPFPPPPVVCKTGINSFSVTSPCKGDYGYAAYATYACMDGYSGQVGNETCQSVDILNKQAQSICAGRSNCSIGGPRPTSIIKY